MRISVHRVRAVAVTIRKRSAAAMHDSPTKLPLSSNATVASFPRSETTVSLTLPFLM